MASEGLNAFIAEACNCSSDIDLLDFLRRKVLHGTPYVFKDREDEFYNFRKKIAEEFGVYFQEIYITGSAKLGFSYLNETEFSLDSDVDVAIISAKLFDKYMCNIAKFQMRLRQSRTSISVYEERDYHKFLEYVAIGWIRPDKLPVSFFMKEIKDDWFDYFRSISNGKSDVGNYKVNAGVFRSYKHLEDYISEGLKKMIYMKNKVKK